MPKVTFKAKRIESYDGRFFVKVPKFRRNHCDMEDFRKCPKFGGYANSTLFEQILERAAKKSGIGGFLHLDSPPECVKVESEGFFTTVSIQLTDWR